MNENKNYKLNIVSNNSVLAEPKKHFILLSDKVFTNKASDDEMKEVYNELTGRNNYKKVQNVSLFQILNFANNGRYFICNNLYFNQYENKMVSKGSSLFFIDYDDKYNSCNLPVDDIVSRVGGCCYFYTPSHGIEGVRLRIGFQLLNSVDDDLLLYLLRAKREELIKLTGVQVDSMSYPNYTVRAGYNKGLGKVINPKIYVNVDFYEKEYKKELKINNSFLEDLLSSEILFDKEEVYSMFNSVGYIPTGVGRRNDWYVALYFLKMMELTHVVEGKEVEELFHIVSGSKNKKLREGDFRVYSKLGNPGYNTLKSFYNLITRSGFSTDYSRFAVDGEFLKYNTKEIKYDDYVTSDIINDIVNLPNIHSVLLHSKPNSGKSTGVINFAKNIIDEKVITIYASPTIYLSRQLAKNNGLVSFDSIYKGSLNDYINEETSNKIIITVYDQVHKFLDFYYNNGFSIILVIDEAHTLNDCISYRDSAVYSFMSRTGMADKILWLTGTIEGVDRSAYDLVINLKSKKNKKTFENFYVYDTPDSKILNYLASILCSGFNKKGQSYLVFYENKESLYKLKEELLNFKYYDIENKLTDEDVIIVHGKSDSSKSKRADIDNRVDELNISNGKNKIILTTNVLAQGISLLNVDKDFHIIVVLKDSETRGNGGVSNYYDDDILVQMMYRYRNTYNSFGIITDLSNSDKPSESKKLKYNSGAFLRTSKKDAENRLNYLLDLNKNKYYNHVGLLENEMCIKLNIEGEYVVDYLLLESRAKKNKKAYYKKNKFVLLNTLSKIIDVEYIVQYIDNNYKNTVGNGDSIVGEEFIKEMAMNDKIKKQEEKEYQEWFYKNEFNLENDYKYFIGNSEEDKEKQREFKENLPKNIFNDLISYSPYVDNSDTLKSLLESKVSSVKRNLILNGLIQNTIYYDKLNKNYTGLVLGLIDKSYEKYKIIDSKQRISELEGNSESYLSIEYDDFLEIVYNELLKNSSLSFKNDFEKNQLMKEIKKLMKTSYIIPSVLVKKSGSKREVKKEIIKINTDLFSYYFNINKSKADYFVKRYLKANTDLNTFKNYLNSKEEEKAFPLLNKKII